jgi:small subunit ribosomal protein S20
MANTRSAKIAQRKSDRRNSVNRSRESRIKTSIKKVDEAVNKGDHAAALKALRSAEAEIMRGVTKKNIEKNAAARKVSRLNARVKKLKSEKAAA